MDRPEAVPLFTNQRVDRNESRTSTTNYSFLDDASRREKETPAACLMFDERPAAAEGKARGISGIVDCAGDRIVLEGDNQKQADFLSRSLVKVDPKKLHDLSVNEILSQF